MAVDVQDRIRKRFDELAADFPADVDANDFRVQVVLDLLGDVTGKSMLDAGCGKGRFSDVFAGRGAEVTSVDLSGKLLLEARPVRRKALLQASTTSLPFPAETFDCVISVEVIEHVPNLEHAITEMVRVLKTDGQIIIIDKNKLAVLRVVWKKYRELLGRWMYPRDFPFTERWFFPWEVRQMLAKQCRETEIRYLGENTQDSGGLLYTSAITASRVLQWCFPVTTFYLAWRGEK